MQSLQSVLSFCCPVSSSLLATSFLFASTNIGLNIYKPWWQVFLPKPDAKAQESESSSFVLVGFGLFVSLFLNFLYLAYVVPSSCSINNCWKWVNESLNYSYLWLGTAMATQFMGPNAKCKLYPLVQKAEKTMILRILKYKAFFLCSVISLSLVTVFFICYVMLF